MNVVSILAALGPVLSNFVNIPALEKVVATYVTTEPGQDPRPLLIANADTLFPDPLERSLMILVLNHHFNTHPTPVAAAA